MDISTNIHVIIRSPLPQRIYDISNLVDHIPFKDLQTCYPTIVNSIFGNGGASEDWGLRSTTAQNTGYEHLYNFLKPNGALFRICYKLLGDPQLKYVFPTRLLPLDVFQMLESGRMPQFYLDILNLDPHTRQIVSLNLNPFDYYIFHFAVYLHSAPPNKGPWDTWNTVYYTLCCDYLLHFLPADPTTAVTPHIAYFTGKTPPVSPMQTSTRNTHFPSLLLSQDLNSPGVASTTSQLHPRGEIWRSETVLQVFIDNWLTTSISQPPTDQQLNQPQLSQSTRCTYPAHEHVRIARALIKQCHSFSFGGRCDPSSLGDLRRATPTILQSKAISHIRHLMHSWPLDASFRLVLELWFSYIQPWRYSGFRDEKNNQPEKHDSSNEDNNRSPQIDRSFLPFISENILAYTEIFQLVVPRFLRLDLTAPKNAIMLFRLAKVFSQSNLVLLLTEVEKSITENGMEPHLINNQFSPNVHSQQSFQFNTSNNTSGFLDRTSNSMDTRFLNSLDDNGMNYETLWHYLYDTHHSVLLPNLNQGLSYKTGLSSMMDCTSSQYQALFLGMGRSMIRELLQHCRQALVQVEALTVTRSEQLEQQRKGFFGTISYWLMGDCESSDEIPLEELKKVPGYINFAITQLAQIFSLEVTEQEMQATQNNSEMSYGSANNNNINRRHSPSKYNLTMSPKDALERAKHIKYMGNPDLQPVKTNENGFLVHILHQISTKLNEMYFIEMNRLYNREGYIGVVAREILEPPCEIKSFCKSGPNYGSLVSKQLSPRLCLRPLASHSFLFWFAVFFVISYLFKYPIPFFIFLCLLLWLSVVTCKASVKYLSGNRTPPRIVVSNANVYYAARLNVSDDNSEFLYSREHSD